MTDNNSENTVFTYNTNNLNYDNIRFAFDKLLGPLCTATVYNGFGEKKEEYAKILRIISNWSSLFEEKKTLVYIDNKEMLSIYYKLEELNDELIYKVDSELSDQIVIWYWELMLLRKKQIDNLK